MSITKQIALGVLATVSLGLFGIGSYYASRTLFPDPKTSGVVTPTPSVSDSAVPTVNDMKHLTPQNVVTKAESDNVVLTFETAEKVATLVYVTSNKTEKIEQAMKDYTNGIPLAGRWFTVSSESEARVAHSVSFPKSIMATTGDTYFYIIVSYKKYWLPYGSVTDFQSGVAEPYTIKL